MKTKRNNDDVGPRPVASCNTGPDDPTSGTKLGPDDPTSNTKPGPDDRTSSTKLMPDDPTSSTKLRPDDRTSSTKFGPDDHTSNTKLGPDDRTSSTKLGPAGGASEIDEIDLTTGEVDVSLHSFSHPIRNLSKITRKQFGSISIPDVCQFPVVQKDVKAIFENLSGPTDPFGLSHRPPESVVKWAEDALKKTRRGKRAAGVVVGSLGNFTSFGVEVLRKYCQVAKVKQQITQEEYWLSKDDGLSPQEIEQIMNVLWECTMGDTILSVGARSIDVDSFTTLVNERYLDNFVINCVILQYVQDQARSQGLGQVIFLPSETFIWLQSGDDSFIINHIKEAFNNSKVNCAATLLIIPLRMEGCHWGLVVIDCLNGRLCFDDGMKLRPRKTLLPDVIKILDLVQTLQPDNKYLSSKFWKTKGHFERFGMPYQVANTDQGSGSCGVGIILAARDLMQNPCLSKFNWDFNSMRTLRKHLCLKIIGWKK